MLNEGLTALLCAALHVDFSQGRAAAPRPGPWVCVGSSKNNGPRSQRQESRKVQRQVGGFAESN